MLLKEWHAVISQALRGHTSRSRLNIVFLWLQHSTRDSLYTKGRSGNTHLDSFRFGNCLTLLVFSLLFVNPNWSKGQVLFSTVSLCANQVSRCSVSLQKGDDITRLDSVWLVCCLAHNHIQLVVKFDEFPVNNGHAFWNTSMDPARWISLKILQYGSSSYRKMFRRLSRPTQFKSLLLWHPNWKTRSETPSIVIVIVVFVLSGLGECGQHDESPSCSKGLLDNLLFLGALSQSVPNQLVIDVDLRIQCRRLFSSVCEETPLWNGQLSQKVKELFIEKHLLGGSMSTNLSDVNTKVLQSLKQSQSCGCHVGISTVADLSATLDKLYRSHHILSVFSNIERCWDNIHCCVHVYLFFV